MLKSSDTGQTDNSNTPTLQPMGVSEILDITFSFYRRHFLLFLGVITFYFFGSLVKHSIESFLLGSDLKNLVANLVDMPFEVVSIGGIIVATTTIYFGGHITSSAALKQSLRHFWHLLGCYLLWALPLMIPVIVLFIMLIMLPFAAGNLEATLFIPFAVLPFSLYFMVRWSFVAEVFLIERTGIKDAFKRSSELVRGTWWRVFGILALILMLSAAIHYILEFSLGSILILTKLAGATNLEDLFQWSVMETDLDSSNLFFFAVMTCADLVLRTLTAPIWVIGVTLLYFDLRIRKEGFDIELQASDSGLN